MDITHLKSFLLHANAAGYASGKEKAWVGGLVDQRVGVKLWISNGAHS